MLPRHLFHRSLSIKAPWKQQGLDLAFQNFECKREDVLYMENSFDGTTALPVACSFSKANKDILALADENGNLIILDTTKSGSSSILKDWHAHSNAVFDLDWMPGEGNLVTASGDQTMALWDVEVQDKVLLFVGHRSSVKSVAFHSTNKDLLVSGSRDGHIMLWDRRVNQQQEGCIQYVHDIPNAHAPPKTQIGNKSKKVNSTQQCGVTAVVFQNENTFASAGCSTGTIKLWDIRKMSSNKSVETCKATFTCQSKKGRAYGISCLVFDHAESYLFASCLDGSIYQFDCLDGSTNYKSMPVTCYRGHKVDSFFVKLSISPDDEYIMSGSSDHSAYVWPIRRNHHRGNDIAPITLVGHGSEVTSVAWCQSDILRTVTLGDDNTACIWRSNQRGKENYDEDLRPFGRAVKCLVDLVISTPRKCFFTSPIKKQTTPLCALQSLSNLPSSHRFTSPSPTITSFFSRSSVKKNAHTMTPKQLILSPRKINPNSSGPSGRGVKRKLCVDDDDNPENIGSGQLKSSRLMKMPRIDSSSEVQLDCSSVEDRREMQENNDRESPLQNLFSTFSLGSLSNVLGERCPNTMSKDPPKPSPLEKMQDKLTENSFAKVIYNVKESGRHRNSPTANLPNSVREAFYKKMRNNDKQEESISVYNRSAPLVQMPKPNETPPTPQNTKVNWLTQLGLKKTLERSSKDPLSMSPKIAKTPSRPRITKARTPSRTPKSTPRVKKK